MTIRVTLISGDLAAVHVRPSWWERLFGAVEHDFEAYRDPWGWCSDLTDRTVTSDVQRAIDAALRK